MTFLHFLRPSVPSDIGNHVLSFLDVPEIKTLREVSEEHRQIVDSNLSLPLSAKMMGARKKYLEAQANYKETKGSYRIIPIMQRRITEIFDSLDFIGFFKWIPIVVDIVKAIFPFIESTLCVLENVFEAEDNMLEARGRMHDIAIASIFGTQQAFDELPQIHFNAFFSSVDDDPQPEPIMRCRTSGWIRGFLTEVKPGLSIRVVHDDYEDLKTYFYDYLTRKWYSYERWNNKNLIDKNGDATEAWHELRDLVVNGKSSRNGVTLTVVK